MKRASVAELKAKLSEYLGYARRGEDVIVTDRGKPIARLTTLPDDAGMEQHWAELIRSGVMKRGAGKIPKKFWEMPRGNDLSGSVRRALREEREEGW